MIHKISIHEMIFWKQSQSGRNCFQFDSSYSAKSDSWDKSNNQAFQGSRIHGQCSFSNTLLSKPEASDQGLAIWKLVLFVLSYHVDYLMTSRPDIKPCVIYFFIYLFIFLTKLMSKIRVKTISRLAYLF